MGYQVGIDLGTTFTAAAVHRDGRSQIFGLGSQSAAVPSVVLLREDQTELTGEAAVRRALNEPERVAREFKRRLGDTTPIIVGGAPYSAEQLMSRLLTMTITEIAKREGGAPERVAVTHPANWGPYKIDLLQQAIRLAGIPTDRVDLLTEPEAAAISYAMQERVEPGEVVAVYDLGGGTFDAAVLRRNENGFEVIGRPEGIERMGGIDFDAAVFAHVSRALDGKLQELDPEDPMVVSGVARLREECVDAKIALSSDTDATIPVLLPNLQTEVRITRNEFENLIRPSLSDSIAAMHRALASADITSADVSKVLLVGGSSRIPLISQMVSSELGRPVAVDADPKHAIALGAAAFAGGALATGQSTAAAPTPAPSPAAAPAAAAAAVTPTEAIPAQPTPALPQTEQMPQQAAPAAAAAAPGAAAYAPTTAVPQQAPAAPMGGGAAGGGGSGGASGGGSKLPLILGAVAAVIALGVAGFFVFGGGGDGGETAEPDVTNEVDDEQDDPEEQPDPDPDDTVAPETTEPAADDTVAPETTEPVPEDTEVPTTPAPVVIDDTTITNNVIAAVGDDIGVDVVAGAVTLFGTVDQATATAAVAAAEGVDGVVSVTSNLTVLLADEICSDEIKSIDRWACVTGATFDGTTLRATYDFDNQGELLTVPAFHMHFFSDSTPPVGAGGTNGGVSNGTGDWEVWGEDQGDFVLEGVANIENVLGDVPTRLCVRIANSGHSLDNLGSGNCFPVTTI